MEELERDITGSRQMLAELSAQGLVRGHGHQKVEMSMQVTEAEKMQAAFDGMLGLEIDQSRFAGVHGFTSIREAYARVTGDARQRHQRAVAGGQYPRLGGRTHHAHHRGRYYHGLVLLPAGNEHEQAPVEGLPGCGQSG